MNEKMKKLREEFAVLDKNGSGNISLTEMKAAVEKKVAGNLDPRIFDQKHQPQILNHELFSYELFNREFFNHEIFNHELFNHDILII